jgi:hypothetical protein
MCADQRYMRIAVAHQSQAERLVEQQINEPKIVVSHSLPRPHFGWSKTPTSV